MELVVVDGRREIRRPRVAQLADGARHVVLQIALEPPLELDALLLLLVLLVLVRPPRPRRRSARDSAAARAARVRARVLGRARQDVADLVVELLVEALPRLRRRRAPERHVDLVVVLVEEDARLPVEALLAVLLVHVLLERRHLTTAHVRRRVLVRLAGPPPLKGLGLHLLEPAHEILDELVVPLGVVVPRLRLAPIQIQIILVGRRPPHDGAFHAGGGPPDRRETAPGTAKPPVRQEARRVDAEIHDIVQ